MFIAVSPTDIFHLASLSFDQLQNKVGRVDSQDICLTVHNYYINQYSNGHKGYIYMVWE